VPGVETVVGTSVWQNTSCIGSADGNYAYIDAPGTISHYLVASGFGFAIPSNSSILGIVVSFYRMGTVAGCQSDYSVKIVQDGVIGGTDHASPVPWPTTWTLASYGSPSDLWGLFWTPSQINSNNFGVAISAQNWLTNGSDCYIDYAQIQVYYTSLMNQVSICGSGADQAGVGTSRWIHPTYITRADGQYSFIGTAGTVSHWLVATGFGFNIPSDASIYGIVAYFYRMGTGVDYQRDYSLKIIQDGTIQGSEHASPAYWPTSWILASYGNSSDLWGLSWTPSQINANNFGVAISTQNTLISGADTYIDYVKIQVYYAQSSPSYNNESQICSSGADKSDVATSVWQNTTSITSADGNYAYIDSPGTVSHWLEATGFGFSIPSDASISGIAAYFYRMGTAVGCQSDYSVKIVQDGVIGGTDHASSAPWPTNWTLALYGNSSDLWGLFWTPSQINDNDFGVAISAQNTLTNGSDCYIDYVQISVYYIPASLITSVSSVPTSSSVNSDFGNIGWSNPDYARLEDGLCAYTAHTGSFSYSYLLETFGYGFNITANATITGIKVDFKCYADSPDTCVAVGQMCKAGALMGLNRGDYDQLLPTSLGWMSYGGPNDLWNATLTPGDVDSGGFGFALAFRMLSGGVYLDAVKITVYYAGGVTNATGGTPTTYPDQIDIAPFIFVGALFALVLVAILAIKRMRMSGGTAGPGEAPSRSSEVPGSEEGFPGVIVEPTYGFFGRCPTCGAPIKASDAIYCYKCGALLESIPSNT
jgi:hypothetical protein